MGRSVPVEQYLARVRDDLREMRGALEGELADAPLERLSARPENGGWSAAEALRHVQQTNRLYLARIERVIEEAEAGSDHAPHDYSPGILGGWFARSQGPNKPRKYRTVRPFVPPPDPSASVVVDDLLEQQARIDGFVDRASRVDLRRRVVSPASFLVRLRLGDALLLLSRHQLRHLKQARRAMSGTATSRPGGELRQ